MMTEKKMKIWSTLCYYVLNKSNLNVLFELFIERIAFGEYIGFKVCTNGILQKGEISLIVLQIISITRVEFGEMNKQFWNE